jgi:hypothetical protein
MQVVIQKQGIVLVGKVKDLPLAFNGVSSQTTLLEYIRRNLH